MVMAGTQTILRGCALYVKRVETIDDKQLKYYTGFDRPAFVFLFNLLTKGEPERLMYTLQPKDQLLLTLYKLRHNLDYKMIAADFGLNPQCCQRTFEFWVLFMHKKFACLDFFEYSRGVPSDFAVVIDCTEMPVVRSKNPLHQQVTYSNYKSRNTFKALVGVSEQGVVLFCSECYGGSISDRQIVKDSNFLDNIKAGDVVLADKGFEISDILQEKGAYLNIPPFKRDKQFAQQDVLKTRVIANRRIIIERINGLAKKNKILVHPMPLQLWKIASEIVKVCFFLCNFRRCI